MKRLAFLIAIMFLFFAQSPSADRVENAPGAEELILEERIEHLGLIIPDDVKIRFEELDRQQPPVLLNPEEYFDWREMGGVTPVKNQGQCGSCWDFAATGAFESAVLIADGIEWDLSEQQVMDCNAEEYGCDGGWMDAVYDLFMYYGAVEEECYPYLAVSGFDCEQETCVVMVVQDDYVDIQNNVDAIKNALLDGPVSTTFMVYDDFHWDCYWHEDTGDLNHAVVIVGWDDNLCDEQGGWIVKNSWGSGWGNDGYFNMPYGSCGIGRYTQFPAYSSRLPEMAFEPESILFNVPSGGEASELLEIENTGTGNLYFRIRTLEPSFQDSFGYCWFDSDNPEGPEYNWFDISDTGELVEFPGDPDQSNSGPIDLGFDFSFYGNDFNSICVCSNGWASFTDSVSTASFNFPIPYEAAPNDLLAAFWTDLDPGLGGDVYFYTNNSDMAIISWVDVYDNWQEGIFTFQIQLIAPDTVIYQYESMGPEGRIDRATIGIEDGTGAIGLEVSRYEIFTYGGKAVQFKLGQPPGEFDWLLADTDHGMVPPDRVWEMYINCSAGDHPAGAYWGIIDIYTNDPENIHVELPVTMNVGMVAVDDFETAPQRFSLLPNYPNPFNPATTIQFELPAASDVRVEIYDILGRQVEVLIENNMQAGSHKVEWHAGDAPSGVYFYKIQAGDYTVTKKMLLLK